MRSYDKDLGMYLPYQKENRWESTKYLGGMHTDGKWELEGLERDVKENEHMMWGGLKMQTCHDTEKHDGHQVMGWEKPMF